jgi:subtilisin family serine protease
MKNVLRIFLIILLAHTNYQIIADQTIDHHVVCSFKKKSNNQFDQKKYSQKIHDATYDLNLACKSLYQHGIEMNDYYPHRRNTVFIVDINHRFHNWTLFKPSFIDFKKFVKLAKKIYKQHGLQVECKSDSSVIITKNHSDGPGVKYLSLDELQTYKKMTDEELAVKLQDTNAQDHQYYQRIEQIKKFLFWHLQIPTTGLLKSEKFDIQDQYKPLAWHFLLWDLAPKKGHGAHVAIIDTGTSAFNVQEKEFSKLYKKNINLHAANNLQDYGYNLVSKNGLDPIAQIAINFGNFCDHEKFNHNELMIKLPSMIIDLIKNEKEFQFEQFFIKNAKKQYLIEGKESLNEEGENVLKSILYGKYGIVPFRENHFFHTTYLQAPYNQETLLETLPSPQLTESSDAFSAGHGTFTQGIVNGNMDNDYGITGLAPDAQVTMIKAFNDRGTTNKSTLNAALHRALSLKNSIVSMSLKITDEIDKKKDAQLKELIDSIDYVVAASGNDGQLAKLKNKEAYPAKFDSVAFDVGAFMYDDQGAYPVCPFTQMELNVGPKIVAPGSNLFSCGLTPGQTTDSMYVFMTGTSIAVPVITGFMALVLAEFQETFSREQILKVVYRFAIKLGADDIWQKNIMLGTPDMRSALLCLHVLASLKKDLKNSSGYSFDDHFENLVQAIWIMNYYVPSQYQEQVHASLTEKFAQFRLGVSEKKPTLPDFTFLTPDKNDMQSCIDNISHAILHIIDNKQYSCPQYLTNHVKLIATLQNIITTKKYNLFSHLSNKIQTRIKHAFLPRLTYQQLD